MRTKFLKWLTITAVIAVVIILLQYFLGLFTLLITNDATYICCGLIGLFAFGVGTSLKCCFRKFCDMSRLVHLADVSTKLGLLGTVLSLALAFYLIGTGNYDFTNSADVALANTQLLVGMGTALTTTAMGLLVALSFDVYVYFMRDSSCKEESKCDLED